MRSSGDGGGDGELREEENSLTNNFFFFGPEIDGKLSVYPSKRH